MIDSDQQRFALEAVRDAARLVRTIQQEMVTPALTKKDRSPVTVGDFAAQAVVADRLRNAFPDDLLVGEEKADTLRSVEGRETLQQVTQFVSREIDGVDSSAVCDLIDRGGAEATGRFWTLDPIDGTKGFLRGGQYAVCLALIENGEVCLGALGCPQLDANASPSVDAEGALILATRGEGAWVTSLARDALSPSRLRVSSQQDPHTARMLRSVEAAHTDEGKIDQLARALDISADPVRLDSQAKYALLAAGMAELLLRLISPSRPDYKEMIWDQAAGSLVVEEAGGQVTDLDGQRLDFGHGRTLAKNRGVLASNGLFHEAVLKALRQISA